MTIKNKQWLLKQRPQGEARESDFELKETDVPPLADGHLLIKVHHLSLDPYMRGRMEESKSYAAPQPLGEVMIGATVGEVIESRNPKYRPGDMVLGPGGWARSECQVSPPGMA
jgi:NADPH-dependent curcumin reductase CurA